MDSELSRVKAYSSATAASRSPAFTPNCRRGILQLMHTSDRHIISPVLAVTEPTALPTAISALPSKAENTETSISGMVVAKLTTVAPIINFGMPEASAIQLAASTKRSPPFIMQTRPTANRTRTSISVLPVKSIPIMILPLSS